MNVDEAAYFRQFSGEQTESAVGMFYHDIFRCARCGQDHQQLQFSTFAQSVVDEDGTTWPWYTYCPTTGEVVLMRPVPDEAT